jgi:gas vesicle protein
MRAMDRDRMYTALVSFLLGALAGALLGLFFAPMSGKELQYRVRKEAELDAEKLRSEYRRNMVGVQRKVDGMKAQMKEFSPRG